MQGDIVELERRRTAEHREVQCTHARIIELIETQIQDKDRDKD